MEHRLTKSQNKWLQVKREVLLGGGWQLHDRFFASTHALDWRSLEAPTTLRRIPWTSVLRLIWRNDLLLGNRADLRNSFEMPGA